MKVAIDPQIPPGGMGGIAVAVTSLVQGLAQLVDGPEEYALVVDSEDQRAWLSPFLGPNQSVVMRPQQKPGLADRLQQMIPLVRSIRGSTPSEGSSQVSVSTGFLESLGCDVLHLPSQNFLICALPTIYNPHDLQHLSYPQFFPARLLAWRETVYRAGCHFARTVVVGSQWVKEDVVRHYRIDPDKIQVIPEAAPTQLSAEPTADDLERVRRTYQLEPPFILYPAVMWAHKNHLRLFEALARLRDNRGLMVRLVCTGAQHPPFWPKVEAGIRTFKLAGQTRFLGHVPDADLRALYRLASCLVLPSLYEASSLPIFEAWLDGLPVACSNVTALPEQVRDAALLFNPTDTDAIADAIARATTDADLRSELRTRGYERLKDFDLLRTAKAYRAVYRRAGGFPLTEEDRWLLEWDWMREAAQPRADSSGTRQTGNHP
jgi:glycosyltransferase involved in cell wall biosynthesis